MSNADGLRIGCQTITWGGGQCEVFPEIFSACAEAGYEGLEIGFRHVRNVPVSRLKEMLAEHGLELVASHVGGNLADTAQADSERRMLDQVLDYLNALDTERLMYSGLKFQSDEQFAEDLAMLDTFATQCSERGVRLLYHNHDWELAGDARVMTALLEDCGPDLGFCPDIGWVAKGGARILPLLERMGERVGAIHLKDFGSTGPGIDTVMLGQGIAALEEAIAWAAGNRPGLWLIAEQDETDAPPGEAIRRNADYVRHLLGQGKEQ